MDLIKREDAIKVIEETAFIRRPILPHYIKAKIKKIPSAEPTISKMEQVDKDIDVPDKTYEDGMAEAWRIAQIVFGSTVTLYEAIDVAKCMKGTDDED